MTILHWRFHVKQTRKTNPYDTLFDAILTIVDYEFEGSDVSSDEFELAKTRFKSALLYIINNEMEKQNERS